MAAALPELEPLFADLNRRCFGDRLRPIPLRWSGRLTRSAGLYYFREGQGQRIALSRPLLAERPHADLLATLAHEMIHHYVLEELGLRESHGPHFRLMMRLINSSQSEFQVSIRHGFVNERSFRWKGICPNCFVAYYRQRRQRGSCSRCHPGFDPRFLLTWERLPAQGSQG